MTGDGGGGGEGLGAVHGEIPAASAGMTEMEGGYDGKEGAGMTGDGGGGGEGVGCWWRRDTRGKRGYDGDGGRV